MALALVLKKRCSYRSYTFHQKLEPAEFAKIHGVHVAARHFDIPAWTLSEWGKLDSEKNRYSTPRGRKPGGGRKVTYGEELDTEILTWVLESRKQQIPVTISLLSAYAMNRV